MFASESIKAEKSTEAALSVQVYSPCRYQWHHKPPRGSCQQKQTQKILSMRRVTSDNSPYSLYIPSSILKSLTVSLISQGYLCHVVSQLLGGGRTRLYDRRFQWGYRPPRTYTQRTHPTFFLKYLLCFRGLLKFREVRKGSLFRQVKTNWLHHISRRARKSHLWFETFQHSGD